MGMEGSCDEGTEAESPWQRHMLRRSTNHAEPALTQMSSQHYVILFLRGGCQMLLTLLYTDNGARPTSKSRTRSAAACALPKGAQLMTEAQQPCGTLPVKRPLTWNYDIHLTSAAPSISVWQPHLSTQPEQQPIACYGCLLMGAVPKGLQAWCCRERCSQEQEQPIAYCGCLLMGAVPKRLQAWRCREPCSQDQEQPTASCGCLLMGAAYTRLQAWCGNSVAVQLLSGVFLTSGT